MIRPDSKLTVGRVDITQVYLRSNQQPEALDSYFAWFHETLIRGEDLPPVLLLRDQARDMYRLQDGRKRYAAHILAGRPEILAVVEERT